MNWFRGGKKQQQQLEPQEYTIDDLIVLERYEEAEGRLRARLKDNPSDLHSHLKLAEVYTQLRQFGKAVDEYGFVAEEYAQDGFYEKGIALLSRAMKLAPLDQSLRLKTDKLQRQRGLEHVRTQALEGLSHAGGIAAGTSMVEIKRLWHHVAGSSLVQHLSGDQLKRLFATMEYLRLEAGTLIAREGSQDAFLVLIVSGVVEARIQAEGREVMLRSFSSGDIIGESTLMERGTWPSEFRVAEPVVALKLNREGLERGLLGNPDPRAYLEALREQHNDREVATTVRRLRGGS